MSELSSLSVAQQRELLASKQVTSRELVDGALARIEQVQPDLNCFVEVWADESRERARSVDISTGGLAGIPIAIKDTSSWIGHRSTSGSRIFEHNVARHTDAVVQKLLDAGAIIVGSTNTPEFAHAGITDNLLWGATRNPHNHDRTTGGSSGGSAAAVASGCVALAEGSDMGGSVRIPASWCGIVGLKPSLGRIPMTALPGLFDTLSHHGPLARTVDDVWEFLLATQGPSMADPFSVHAPLTRPLATDINGIKIGLSIDLGCWDVDPEIATAVRDTAQQLTGSGATVHHVDPQFTIRDGALWLEMWGIFMASYYGHLVEEHQSIMDPLVVWLIQLGESFSAVDAKRMEIERTDFWNRATQHLHDHDVLICPTMSQAPGPATKIDNMSRPALPDNGLCQTEDMTSVWNLASPLPIVSVPCGYHTSEMNAGLPIGLQIVGKPGREDQVLAVATAIEELTLS
jgi:Asp-tRNA(Asn)/Glu-tRNA(Gln) amidotransferase A subunit family amidase